VVAAFDDVQPPGGRESAEDAAQPRQIAEAIPRAGEKEHGDPDAVEVGIAHLRRVVRRMQGIAQEDQTCRGQPAFGRHPGSDPPAHGLAGGDDAGHSNTGVLPEDPAGGRPRVLQFPRRIGNLEPPFLVGKVKAQRRPALSGQAVREGGKEGMLHVVAGAVGHDDCRAAHSLFVERQGENGRYRFVSRDGNGQFAPFHGSPPRIPLCTHQYRMESREMAY